MEWWMIWLLFFGIFFGCGRMCGWHRHDRKEKLERMRHRRQRRLHHHEPDYAGAARWDRDSGRRAETEEAMAARQRRPQGSQLERLQRDFVEGRISMDEYERRLDSLEFI